MSETRSLHVLVAGGGLAGLATAQQLDRYGRGEVDLLDAVGTYEEQMRETAYPILRMTVDHDKNFGGGALAEATKGSEPA
jgi:2-polyprenyl-6-methoxyphenol hydroxylase-like FAD-dependent oxidoreductase